MEEKALLNKAIQLLAQSALTEKELTEKLMRFALKKSQFQPPDLYNTRSDFISHQKQLQEKIQCVVSKCIIDHWIDDKEYGKRFIESRLRKGYGKNRILFELKQKGISLNNFDTFFSENQDEILEKITFLVEKKFGNIRVNNVNIEMKQRIWRYLQYRGFVSEEIMTFINRL